MLDSKLKDILYQVFHFIEYYGDYENGEYYSTKFPDVIALRVPQEYLITVDGETVVDIQEKAALKCKDKVYVLEEL